MKNDIEKKLKDAIIQAVKNAFNYDIEEEFVVIEIPKDNSLGDYATNTAMRLAKPGEERRCGLSGVSGIQRASHPG